MSNEQHNTIDTVNETGQLNKLGFWVFLTAEIALFGTLFATFLVLQKSGSYAGASSPFFTWFPKSVTLSPANVIVMFSS